VAEEKFLRVSCSFESSGWQRGSTSRGRFSGEKFSFERVDNSFLRRERMEVW
jgi:hypothetical protein